LLDWVILVNKSLSKVKGRGEDRYMPSDGMWDRKRCACMLCNEEPFNSINEGRVHVFLVHKISYNKTRKHLKTKL
jgi:hypothetical protein